MKRGFDIAGVDPARSVSTRGSAESSPAKRGRLQTLDPHQFAKSLLQFHPEPQQVRVLEAKTSRGILCCNRQFGKSTTVAALAVHRAYYSPGSLLIVISPTLRQSHELLRKIAAFLSTLGIASRTDGFNSVSLLVPNGSRIVAVPANPDTLRGFSSVSMLLIDEAARVPDSVYEAATPMLARSAGSLWLLSTPKGRTGFFHDIWHSHDPRWLRVHSTALDCPRIPAAFLASERTSKPAAVFDQEYLCIFQDAGDQYFASDDLAAAFSSRVRSLGRHAELSANTRRLHYYIGLDLGKSRDHTAIAVIEHRVEATAERDPRTYDWITETTARVRWLERIPLGTTYDEVIRRVADLVDRPTLRSKSTLVVDATGPGAPVVDQIRPCAAGGESDRGVHYRGRTGRLRAWSHQSAESAVDLEPPDPVPEPEAHDRRRAAGSTHPSQGVARHARHQPSPRRLGDGPRARCLASGRRRIRTTGGVTPPPAAGHSECGMFR